MTFTQVEYFLEAAKCKNLTKAAENLFVTQQAVSKQIQSLERELGFSLIQGNNKGIALTSAGEICFRAWEEIMELQENAIRQAREAVEGKTPLRVGISDIAGICDYVLPVFEAFNGAYSQVNCIYEVDGVVNLCHKMNQNKLDLIISLMEEVVDENYMCLPLKPMDINVGVTLGRNHSLADRDKLTLQDISREKILLLKDSYSKKAAECVWGYLKQEKFQPVEVEYYDNISALKLALGTGKGVTIAYDVLWQGTDNRLKFFPLDIPKEDYWIELAVAWNRKENGGYAKDLVKLQENLSIDSTTKRL